MPKEHHYAVTVDWTGNKGTGTSAYGAYARAHEIRIAGKPTIPGSSDPSFRGDPARYNPEELLVASLSACHMLWFLHLACQKNWVVERYVDEAVGILDKTWMSRVTLRPAVSFSGKRPTEEEHAALHHRAHEKCYIANSVKTEIVVEPCLK